MFVIIPVRLIAWLRPIILALILAVCMFPAGVFLTQVMRLLFAAPKSLAALHLAAIPIALVTGWFLFRLWRQLGKSPMDEESGLIFRVGFSAWLIFLLIVGAFVGGVWVGGTGNLIQAHSLPDWQAGLQQPSTPKMLPQPETQSGRIYIAPTAAASPKAATPSQP